MKKTLFAFLFAMCAMVAVAQTPTDTVRHQVLFETNMGNIRVVLYNETPKHRDNFLRLVKSGYYNGTIFHRVIENFMIQGGDSTSLENQLVAIRPITLCLQRLYFQPTITSEAPWQQRARATMLIPSGNRRRLSSTSSMASV